MESDQQLEQFVLLAKGTRGRASADLALKATAAPGLFSFGELLDVPSMQEVGLPAATYAPQAAL